MLLDSDSPGRFRPPSVAAHEVVRERLLMRLTSTKALRATQVTLVLGPAGFGKTTLLAQAYRRVQTHGDSAVWLECSELDAKPAHFVDTLYAAGAAAGMRRDNQEFTTDDFARRIGGLGAGVYVFVDAVDRLVAHGAEALLERLTGLLPGNVHVLLGSRLPLNTWFLNLELQGIAATVDAQELRLTRAELSALLPQRFNAQEIIRVEQITEGWPVAVQLTRLRAADAVTIAETLKWLTHEGLGLFDYLAERVLESLSAEQRMFLRDTSVLPTVNVISANAMLRTDDGFALMSAVLRLQPIVTITGDRAFTIRLHPLLRQYMRNELARQGHKYERELNRRAAEVLVASGEVPEGVQHAMLAEDLPLAVELFERAGGDALIFKIGARRVLTLVTALPAAARAFSSSLKLVDVLMASVEGRAQVVRDLRADLMRQLAEAPGACNPEWRDYASGLCDVAVTLLADLYQGIATDAVEQCAAAERTARLHFAKDEAKLGFVLALQVLIYARHCGVADARRTLTEYVALVERNGFGSQHPSVNPQRGLLAFLTGDVESAFEYLSRHSPARRVDRFAEPEPLLAQMSAVLVAAMHYERNEIEKAHQIINQVGLDPDRTFPETWVLCCRVRAMCFDALGRPAEADHLLAEEQERAERRAATRFGLMVEATQLELAIRNGSPTPGRILRLTDALEAELVRSDASWLFIQSLASGVVLGLVALGEPERGRRLADRLIGYAQARGHLPFAARSHLLAARAAEMLRDEAGALAAVAHALSLTAPGGIIRPYLDILGRPPAVLLRALAQVSRSETADHLRIVLRSCDAFDASPSCWVMLSERERDVLWALSVHTSTKAIAKQLGVSPETVKHHLKRIFAKLGVHSREEALQRAAYLAD